MLKPPFSCFNLLVGGTLAFAGVPALAQGPGGPPVSNPDPMLIRMAPSYSAIAPRTADLQFIFRKPVALPGGVPVNAWGSQSGYRTGTVTGSGTRQVRFDPAQDWLPGEEVSVYYATTPATLDQAQPSLALISAPFLRFRVAPAPADGPLVVQSTPPAVGIVARQIATADFDGDGKAEVVLAGTNAGGAGEVRILRSGSGGYTVLAAISTTPAGNFGLGDLNNDGAVDLLVSDAAAGSAIVKNYLNPGTGIFSATPNSTISVGPGATQLQVADLNGDKSLDLLTVNDNQTVSQCINNGLGQLIFSGVNNYFVNLLVAKLVRMNAGATGYLLVATDSDVRLYTQDGSGGFFNNSTLIASAIDSVNEQAAGDFTGDGVPEFVMATKSGVWLSQRVGGFYQTTAPIQGEECSAIQPADVDGDGDLDLLAALPNAGVVRVLLNDGTGTFTPDAPLTLAATPVGLAVADLNADGTLDAVTANSLASASVSELLNSAPSSPRSVVVSTAQKLSGTYVNVTVTGTGSLTLTADLTILGALTVQAGGKLNPSGYHILGPGNVQVLTDATLEIVAASGLTTTGNSGDFQNTGSRVFSGAARYEFRGMTAQQTGPGLPATVKELQVDNSAGVTLTQATAISRALWLTSGNLVSNGRLTLLSSATGTAMVVNTDGVVEGNATMQRFISAAANAGRGYRHLSSPVQNTTFQDLTTSGFSPIVNGAFNVAANPLAVRPYPNIFGYDESRLSSTASGFGNGYFSPAALTDPLLPGRGYATFLSAVARPDFTGVLNSGTINSGTLTSGNEAESGWQLLGNPYPSPLAWDAIASTLPAAMSRQISVFRSTGANTGTYVTRLNGVSTPDPNGVLNGGWIAPMQGFFVRVTQPGTAQFNFRNQARANSVLTASAYRTAVVPQVHLRVMAIADTAQIDYATIYCDANATTGLETAFDAGKLRSEGAPTLFTRAVGANEALALNGIRPLSGADVVLPIGLEVPAGGTYQMTATALDLPAGWRVVLEDALTGTAHELHPDRPYLLTLPVGPVADQRLHLRLTSSGVVTGITKTEATNNISFGLSPNPARDVVNVQLPVGNNPELEIIDATGRVIRTVKPEAANFTLSLQGLPAGVYVVRSGSASRRLMVQ